MHTFSVIGSDKNAGKTTVLNHIRRQWQEENRLVCTTSIGINGESCDNYEGFEKPLINFLPGEYFVTATRQISVQTGKFHILKVFAPPLFSQEFLLGRCELPFSLTLEGPNDKQQLIALKKELKKIIPAARLLIDGSIDRQFIAHPDISDAFFFALLSSERKEQNTKANDLLFALNIPTCSDTQKALIERTDPDEKLRFCLFDKNFTPVLKGDKPAFSCPELKEYCLKNPESPLLIYLNGALSPALCNFLRPFKNLEIILHNFTLYLGISTRKKDSDFPEKRLKLRHPLVIEKIFLQQQGNTFALKWLPEQVPICNLFRE